METTKRGSLIPSVESPQGNICSDHEAARSSTAFTLSKKLILCQEIMKLLMDQAGSLEFNIVQPLCLVTMLSISCNVVF